MKGTYDCYVPCREKLEDQLEKEARFRQLIVHSSHDSAIDTDSMEWETEVVEFEKRRVSTVNSLKHNKKSGKDCLLMYRTFSYSGHGFESAWV